MDDDRLVARFGELERLDQQWQVVAVDGAKVAHSKLLEYKAAAKAAAAVAVQRLIIVLQRCLRDSTLEGFLPLEAHPQRQFSRGHFRYELLQVAGDLVVARIGDQLVEVGRDGADVLGDRPLVIVEDTDKLFRRVCDVIKGLERDAVGQCGIAEDADDVLTAAALVACGGHAQCRRQCRAGVAGAVAVVLALGAQREAVQSVSGADGAEALLPAGE